MKTPQETFKKKCVSVAIKTSNKGPKTLALCYNSGKFEYQLPGNLPLQSRFMNHHQSLPQSHTSGLSSFGFCPQLLTLPDPDINPTKTSPTSPILSTSRPYPEPEHTGIHSVSILSDSSCPHTSPFSLPTTLFSRYHLVNFLSLCSSLSLSFGFTWRYCTS